MHMADALLSPAIGGTFWAATAATLGFASRKLRKQLDDRKIPLMGVLGAFIFAAQMITFTIPGTGSSGHLGGGMILAVLLGPHAAFLVMAAILTVQALFFADGGLLALGCNIFNLGVFPCYIAYPCFFRPLAGTSPSPGKITLASLAASIVGLQMGAFGVVLETVLSGISELPFSTFVLTMQPIHLAIGIVEGLITAAVLNFLRAAEPGLLEQMTAPHASGSGRFKKVLYGFLVAALLTGGVIAWFASTNPDGLEWSVAKVSGKESLAAPGGWVHRLLARIQEKMAFLPDYGLRKDEAGLKVPSEQRSSSPVNTGTSISGVVGGLLTLLVVAGLGYLLRRNSDEYHKHPPDSQHGPGHWHRH